MKREMHLYLQDIYESIEEIESFFQNVTQQEFEKDKKLQGAVIWKLLTIGEAVKQIPKEFTTQHSHIPWSEFAGLRDVLVHQYFGILLDRVWTIAHKELPELKEQIKKFL